MKIKLNLNTYLNMLCEAENDLTTRILLEKQAEIDEYNNSWLVKLGLFKKGTLENYYDIQSDSYLNEVYWSEGELKNIKRKLEALYFAIKESSKDYGDIIDVEVTAEHLMYLKNIRGNTKIVITDGLD